jgi:hypothetical protein
MKRGRNADETRRLKINREDRMQYPQTNRHPSYTLAAAIGAALAAGGAGGAAVADAPTTTEAPATALQCGHLIDTAAGKMLGATTIVIEGGRVKDVVSGAQSPAGAKVIEPACLA